MHWNELVGFSCPTDQLKCVDTNSTTSLIYGYCIQPKAFDCTAIPQCQCPTIKAEPDIAGIGMISSFILSTTITLISSILCLTLYSDPHLTHTNPLDIFFRRLICDPVQRLVSPARARNIAHTLYAMIMAISDQQIITGIALLGAAVRNLPKRSITVYHFDIIMDMAWFSSNTHLLALCVTRSFLETTIPSSVLSRTRSHGGLPRNVRIMAMLVLAGLLLYCSSVSGYELWDDHVNCPALCITRGKRAGAPYRQMVVTFVFVLQSYTVQIGRVTPSVKRFFHNHVYPWVKERDEKAREGLEKKVKVVRSGYMALRAVGWAFWVFFTSDFEFMLEMVAWYTIGLYWALNDRKDGHKHMEAAEIWKENHIGFGQLVPLLLILLATLAGMEGYLCRDTYRQSKEETRRKSDSTMDGGDLKTLERSTTKV